MEKEIHLKFINHFDKFIQDFEVYLDYILTYSKINHQAIIHEIVYYKRKDKSNGHLKDGDLYPGFRSPDKQVNNLGFWYIEDKLKTMSFEEFCTNKSNKTNTTYLQEWKLNHPERFVIKT